MQRKRNGPAGGASRLASGNAGWKNSVAARWFLLLLFAGLFYVSLAPRFVPETYDIRLNAVSDRDIKAPRQEVNEEATYRAREAAAERVGPVYTIVSIRNESLIDEIFQRIDQLNQDDLTSDDKVDIYRREIPQRLEQHVNAFIQAQKGTDSYSPQLLEEMRRSVLEQKYTIPEETFYKLPRLTPAQIAEMRQVGRDVVRRIMAEPISDAESARTQVAELVNASPLTLKTEREIVQELARFAITPNRFLDEAATEAARKEAMENTPPVIIKQGEVIVRKGQVITEDVYALLEKFNLLKEKKTYLPQLGVLLLALLLTFALYGYGELAAAFGNRHTRPWTNVEWFMLWFIFAINMLLMHLVALTHSSDWPLIVYAAPVATGSMLVTLLLGTQWGLASSFVFALLAAAILNVEQETLFDFRFGLVGAVVGFTAVLAIHRASQRSTILKAGIMVSLFGSLAVLALTLVEPEPDTAQLLTAIGFMMVGGLVTAVLVIGLMPFFESAFGILSALKLVELSNPNHPLLRKLLTETPGTYHHSLMVGNLAEAAAEAIGASGLLCRVGSFYHDVGKTKRPLYFIENQNGGPNPHDQLDPKVSASIIIAHARDGADMLKTYKLPKPIRDIAEQHHGTSLLKYFYHKMLKEAEAQGIDPPWSERDFRYPGPKAQTKEAAIVGIADSVEAAVRSLHHPTVEQIEGIIGKIIKDRLDDGQLSECDLTLRELDTIARAMKETVIGMFHSRIDYPVDKTPKEREAAGNERAEQASAAGPAQERSKERKT